MAKRGKKSQARPVNSVPRVRGNLPASPGVDSANVSNVGTLDGSGNVLLVKSDGSASLLVVFSSVNSNGFSFYKSLEALNVNKLFIRDPYDEWFNKGISAAHQTIESISSLISEVKAALNCNRLVTFGTSMGGYASLVFGNLCGADCVVSSSPQTLIDSLLPHTPQKDLSDSPFFDLEGILARESISRRHLVFFGFDDIVDIYNVSRIKWGGAAELFAVSRQDHLLATLLSKSGEYIECLKCALDMRDYTPSVEVDVRSTDALLTALVRRLVESEYLKAPFKGRNLARALRELEPNWAAPHYAMAQMEVREGNLLEGERYAARAVKLSRNSVTFANYHAQLLARLGRDDEAEEAFQRVLRLRGKHYPALVALAQIRARKGDIDGAIVAAESAIAIRPRLKRAQLVLAEIKNGAPNQSQFLVEAEDM